MPQVRESRILSTCDVSGGVGRRGLHEHHERASGPCQSDGMFMFEVQGLRIPMPVWDLIFGSEIVQLSSWVELETVGPVLAGVVVVLVSGGEASHRIVCKTLTMSVPKP